MSATNFDTAHGYGRISRLLHWGMAVAFLWQFTGAFLHAVDRSLPISSFFWSTHRTLGLCLFILVLLRGIWGLINAKSRPAHPGSLGMLAWLGHLALYALMIAVPALALLRQYGSGRAFEPFGIPLMPGGGEQVAWMTAPGNAAHGPLGWTLLALVAGHVIMALIHHFVWKDGTLHRMVPAKN